MRQSVEKNSRKDPDCRGVSLDGEINELSVSSKKGKVNAISFTKDGNKLNFGSLSSDSITETFDDASVLFGLFGYQQDAEIKSIGFITLDPECLTRVGQPVEAATIVDNTRVVTVEEPDSMVNPMLFIIIGALVAVIILFGCIGFCCKKCGDKKETAKKSQIEIISQPPPVK